MSSERVRWALLYWMPYRNDLSPFERLIIEMLGRGIAADDVVVVVQSEVPFRNGMLRTVLRQGRIASQAPVSGIGSDTAALRSFLRWARRQFDAARWGLIVLGHGGTVDEFCPSESPDRAGTRWMRVSSAARAIAETWECPIELLFMQNCCKGTLESLYTVAMCARFTLSSQQPLGAPNYYYEEALRRLSAFDLDGLGLAGAIMEGERVDMYTSLAATRNDVADGLTGALNELIDSIVTFGSPVLRACDLPWYEYGTERLADALRFFETFAAKAGVDGGPLESFREQYGRFVATLRLAPESHGLSGLSLVIPETRQQARRNMHLAFYRRVRITELLEASTLLSE